MLGVLMGQVNEDGTPMDAGKAKSRDFGLSKPSPTRWSKRVSAATSFYAAFRPLFRRVAR
jgi:hypothetical protein